MTTETIFNNVNLILLVIILLLSITSTTFYILFKKYKKKYETYKEGVNLLRLGDINKFIHILEGFKHYLTKWTNLIPFYKTKDNLQLIFKPINNGYEIGTRSGEILREENDNNFNLILSDRVSLEFNTPIDFIEHISTIQTDLENSIK